jgi:hypothetical protein
VSALFFLLSFKAPQSALTWSSIAAHAGAGSLCFNNGRAKAGSLFFRLFLLISRDRERSGEVILQG